MKPTSLLLFFFLLTQMSWSQKVEFEKIKEQCQGLPYDKRVRLSVSTFNSATPKATGQFGDELSQMLSNALQNVNCFNVLLSVKDSKDLTDEIVFSQTGNTALGSGPQTGKMKGPQVIVMGKVTEFAEGEVSGGAFGIKVGGNKAKIGFIIQLVNAETREIIESKSINVEGKSNGFRGLKFIGLETAGSTANNKALSDACEKGIIQAVEFIAANKNKMPLPEASVETASKVYSAANCSILKGDYVPKIMVILPEFHITERIPDPAAETEINRKLIEAGFKVVDAAMYATIKNGAKFINSAKDPKLAISLGKEFGADIVVYGEAFSQRTGTQGTQVTCRARVEIKAVRTDDATILVSNGLEAGALDNAEFVAAKSALRNAGTLVSNYMLEQFCSKGIVFSQPITKEITGATSDGVTITVKNADYTKFKTLTDLIATKGKIADKTLTQGTGTVLLQTKISADAIADLISQRLGTKYTIQELSSNSIVLIAK